MSRGTARSCRSSCFWSRCPMITSSSVRSINCFFFFFNDTATTEIYTLSLHDALPISAIRVAAMGSTVTHQRDWPPLQARSEEHTSELQSRQYLVCRLLLEKKKKN